MVSRVSLVSMGLLVERIGITPCPKLDCCVTLPSTSTKIHEGRTMNVEKALFIAAVVALPLAAHAQTKQVPPKPSLETNL
jgi:hypothetical protein